MFNIKNVSLDEYAKASYSQEGEDMILQRIFEHEKQGFYVDIGAHHPKRFSNTYVFYKLGWRGVNVDAMPGSMESFDRQRKRDINLELGVGDSPGLSEYYLFNEPALNGFSKQISDERHGDPTGYHIVSTRQIEVKTLGQILDEYLPNNQIINFMTIDVEGFDLQVLQSNNWTRYRPEYILVEILGITLEQMMEGKITHYMREKNYCIYAKCVNTVFFRRNEAPV